jgi:hypothetical protein
VGAVREGSAPADIEDEPRAAPAGRTAVQLGELITRGAVAGLTAGIGFLLANMAYATSEGKPAEAPLMDISTVFHGTSKPAGMTPTVDMVTTGLVTHIGLSILFGISFAALVVVAGRMLRHTLLLALGGVLYGLALYVVNFQIFGNTLFPWFTNPACRFSSAPGVWPDGRLPDHGQTREGTHLPSRVAERAGTLRIS